MFMIAVSPSCQEDLPRRFALSCCMLWVSSGPGESVPQLSQRLPCSAVKQSAGFPCTAMAVHGVRLCSSFYDEFCSLGQLVVVIGIGCVPCVRKG